MEKYESFIEEITIYADSSEVGIEMEIGDKVKIMEPNVLLNGD